jgi:hypothetical protein
MIQGPNLSTPFTTLTATHIHIHTYMYKMLADMNYPLFYKYQFTTKPVMSLDPLVEVQEARSGLPI